MNIGKTGIYLSLSWLIALIVLTLTLFAFAWLLILRIRKLSHKPTRTWATVSFIVLCSVALVILVFAYHDLACAGQDYDRDMSYTCEALPAKQFDFTRTIVVARYKEDTTWINECPAFKNMEHRVYQKAIASDKMRTPRGNITLTEVVPNVGYECSSYAKYIVDNYDNLPDVMFFVHGNPFEHCAGLQKAINSDELYKYDFYLFSRFNYNFRASGWPHFWPHQGFGPVMEKIYRTLFNSPPPKKFQTYFNGEFMVKRELVLRHPKDFYQRLIDLVTIHRDVEAYSWNRKGDGWLECCAFERLWQKVFLDVDMLGEYPEEDAFC